MAKWSESWSNWTPVAVLDTVNYTDLGYLGLMGGSTTQRIDIYEVEISGQAAASAPTAMVLARDSIVQATPTAFTAAGQSNGPLDPATAALAAPQVTFAASTTKPQRAATLAKLQLGLNAFGGIIRWNASPGSEFKLLGNAANAGEAALGLYAGTAGLLSSHILYETF